MSSPGLVDAVRNWVHFDNVCTMLGRQVTTARNMRNTFEERVLAQLGGTKRLRIKGAILEPASRKNSVVLNWSVLEESLHKYYSTQKKTDETDAILKFMREHRETKTVTYLKKTPTEEVAAPVATITEK